MRILLTGATGFIGSAFARVACEKGHQVGGIALPNEKLPDIGPAGQIRWFRGTLNSVSWAEIADFQPEVCVHAAWITTPGIYLESPENDLFRDLSQQFLKQAVVCGVQYVVGVGTCIEYRLSDQPLSENTTPVEPTTRYSRCKNELRIALEADAAKMGFQFCWARVFYPYGPGEHPARLCSALIQKLARNEELLLKTPNSRKDYIYIDDLASAFLCVVERRPVGPINLGTGKAVSVRQIADHLGELAGKPQLIKDDPQPATDLFPNVVADSSRLRAIGWRPGVSLHQGLSRLHQYWQGRMI